MGGNVQGGGQVVHHGVQEELDALVLEGGAQEDTGVISIV
jgi:hypothetical protein